ncbi:anter-specific proline-rich APG [Fusarium heterosporum]|uniref:Anter-specific proline-rich APG n=1 Tax=Fusarium heterosporum TaxID=42747 RepID=A0A8H5T941_FUSHE|nr:anter-specific proline-rich APG [Fusarium heterosporum]
MAVYSYNHVLLSFFLFFRHIRSSNLPVETTVDAAIPSETEGSEDATVPATTNAEVVNTETATAGDDNTSHDISETTVVTPDQSSRIIPGNADVNELTTQSSTGDLTVPTDSRHRRQQSSAYRRQYTTAAPSDHFNKKGFDFTKITKIISFGDSWTDTRFNVSGQQPSSSDPIGNYGKTSSNGKMWPMYLTTQYNKSSILLYNMAVGGAVVDKDIVTTGPNDVDTQVHDKFQVYAQQPDLFPPKETLWTVFIGINDIYRTIDQADQENTIITIIERIRELTTDLYSYGARQFLFISTPPQSLFPNNRPKDIAPKLKAASESWNKKLRSLVHNLDRDLAHSTFFFFDIVPLITAVTDDPSQFPETAIYKSNSFCTDYKAGTSVPDFKSDKCEYNALEYMYIDGAHPTQGFHQVLARKISEQLIGRHSIN